MNNCDFEYRETVEDLFSFVSDVILPSMVDYEHYGDFIFRLKFSAEFDAAVQVVGNRFRVSINTGLIESLVQFIESDLSNVDGVLEAHIDELKDSSYSTDTLTNLVLVASIVFVLLHEVYHAIGGHSEYCKNLNSKTNNTESHLRESTLAPKEEQEIVMPFFELLELEADGGAFSTTLEFSRQIFETVTGSASNVDEYIPWCHSR